MNTEHRPFLPSFLQSKGPPLSPLSITTQGPLLSHSLRPYLLSSPTLSVLCFGLPPSASVPVCVLPVDVVSPKQQLPFH